MMSNAPSDASNAHYSRTPANPARLWGSSLSARFSFTRRRLCSIIYLSRLEAGWTMAALQHIDSPERGVVLLDTSFRITGINRRAAELFGRATEELIGSTLPAGISRRPTRDEDVIEEVLDGPFAPGIVVHRHSSPIYAADGSPSGRVEIYSDITARRELEREIIDRNSDLARLNRQLREAQEQLLQSERLRTLGEMAAGIAHDINNVLGIILGNVQLAKRKIEPESAVAECIGAIELAARDAAETVRRLREIGKPADKSRHELVELGSIVNDVLSGAVPAWEERGLCAGQMDIRVDIQPGCIVRGDATEIREAFANVLLNAVQASSAGGAIDVRSGHSDGGIDLVVRDHGTGMSKETKERLFDPFFTTRGAQGTGLGMSMVDAIMIRHGGRISVESAEGVGTTITLRFPCPDQQHVV
jgi:signal transduction histidine kinase